MNHSRISIVLVFAVLAALELSGISWFKGMLEKIARNLTSEDIDFLFQSVVDFRKVKLSAN